MGSLAPLVAGFFLTTVLGGFLGFIFQRRSWNHQHAVQLHVQERERAVRIFEEVSRLLDKRLYRLRLLYWSLPAGNSRGELSELAESRMDGYRDVLYEWNDSINRNLALIQQYFGDEMRNQLDSVIGSQFVDLGRAVETLWSARREAPPNRRMKLEDRLQLLSSLVYHYNIAMIRAIQEGYVGVAMGLHPDRRWTGRWKSSSAVKQQQNPPQT